MSDQAAQKIGGEIGRLGYSPKETADLEGTCLSVIYDRLAAGEYQALSRCIASGSQACAITREAPGFSHFEPAQPGSSRAAAAPSIGQIGHDQVDAVGFEPRPGHVA